ncbi:MAG TPA: metallophosphoesterase [Candidatus Limiplasma sp.]|nr:metallophosphoesterase [Candidatus Limiplasma sp.]
MAIFAIGDLHLPGNGVKPMDIFGSHWDHHMDTIRENWLRLVSPEDIVLIPGDISWAMQFHDALNDLADIAKLPGTKVLLRGNHDYWWSSIAKLRSSLPDDMYALQNDSVILGGMAICGTRGWTFPTEQLPLEDQELKIYRRELIRLRMALDSAKMTGKPILAMTHFPPLLTDYRDTEYTALLEEYGVETCVYGHLHGVGIRNGFSGEHHGIEYKLVSCDAIDFSPVRICDTPERVLKP